MAEKKELGKISVITDCETSVYHIGEIEGGFKPGELKNHIKKHGTVELYRTLARMSAIVFDIENELNCGEDRAPEAKREIDYSINTSLPDVGK